MRRLLLLLFRFLLHAFYRKVEVLGAEKVPPAPAPVIICLNHPNALVDPLFVLCFVPRPVSFLAKSPLFDVPILGWFCRVVGALPVYRPQDAGSETARNVSTFAEACRALAAGGAVALFPEGTSHSDPGLKPLRTGAARLALLAARDAPLLRIVPVGLYYTEKQRFRSRALAVYGDPFDVPRDILFEGDDPPAEAVRSLSLRIEEALRAVTLNADAHEALDLAARLDRVLAADSEDGDAGRSVAREFEARRRLLDGYAYFREHEPQTIDGIRDRLDRYEETLDEARHGPRTNRPAAPGGTVLRFVGSSLVPLLLLLPVAAAGAAIHYAPYRVVEAVSRRVAREDLDMPATVKLLAALVFFPLTWLAVAALALLAGGPWAGAIALVGAPASGYLAVRFYEIWRRTLASVRAFLYFARRPRFVAALVEERRRIREEIGRLDAMDRKGV